MHPSHPCVAFVRIPDAGIAIGRLLGEPVASVKIGRTRARGTPVIKRTKLGEGGPDSTVAWSTDKVAVGNHGLWIATLADHAMESPEGYTSPSFAPDGTLYVRDPDGSAFKREGDKFVLAKKAKKKKPADPEMMDDEDPEPVTFENGKPQL